LKGGLRAPQPRRPLSSSATIGEVFLSLTVGLPGGAFAATPRPSVAVAGASDAEIFGRLRADLPNALGQRKIRLRAQGDDKGVRLSAHIDVGPGDIDPVLDVVAACARGSVASPA